MILRFFDFLRLLNKCWLVWGKSVNYILRSRIPFIRTRSIVRIEKFCLQFRMLRKLIRRLKRRVKKRRRPLKRIKIFLKKIKINLRKKKNVKKMMKMNKIY